MVEEQFVTTQEAAARLGVSDARVRQMVLSGVIEKSKKFGRSNMIPESEVKRLEKRNRKPGRPKNRER